MRQLALVWALPAEVLPPARIVLAALASFAADDGSRVYPGVARIASMTGLDARSVQRLMRQLEGAGFLVCVRRSAGGRSANGRPLTSEYQLQLTPADSQGKPRQEVTVNPGTVSPLTPAETPPTPAKLVRVNPGTQSPNPSSYTSVNPSSESDARTRARESDPERASNPQAARAPEGEPKPPEPKPAGPTYGQIPKAEREAFKAQVYRNARQSGTRGNGNGRLQLPSDDPERRTAMQRALAELESRKAKPDP